MQNVKFIQKRFPRRQAMITRVILGLALLVLAVGIGLALLT